MSHTQSKLIDLVSKLEEALIEKEIPEMTDEQRQAKIKKYKIPTSVDRLVSVDISNVSTANDLVRFAKSIRSKYGKEAKVGIGSAINQFAGEYFVNIAYTKKYSDEEIDKHIEIAERLDKALCCLAPMENL